jgi:hypothetical protein
MQLVLTMLVAWHLFCYGHELLGQASRYVARLLIASLQAGWLVFPDWPLPEPENTSLLTRLVACCLCLLCMVAPELVLFCVFGVSVYLNFFR